MQLFKL